MTTRTSVIVQNEALVPKAPVEALHITVLPRAAGIDVERSDLLLCKPRLHLPRDELGTVVALPATSPFILRWSHAANVEYESSCWRQNAMPESELSSKALRIAVRCSARNR